ncbi:MAG: S-layer homology domain-containing protein, partial [Lysinibacillus sp.]
MANKYKKFVASAATATLVASAIVPVASANETVKFSDVKDSSEFAPFIYDLAEKKVMSGAAGKFNPAGEVTRSAAVKTLGKWLVNVHGKEIPADYNTVQRFTDLPVDYKDQELLQYAALVKDLGVFTGAAGKLNPTGTLNREQMAKVVVEAYSVVEGVKIVELVADFESSLTDLD